MQRYETQRGADKIMILDRKNGDAIGYVHSAAVAHKVVEELNKMDALTSAERSAS